MGKVIRPYLISTALTLGILGALLLLFSFWANQDTSIYAPGFTEDGFSRVREEMPLGEVRRLIGEPLSVKLDPARETWFYYASRLCRSLRKVEFDPQGKVQRFSGGCTDRLRPGLPKDDVLRLLGPPSNKQPARSKTLYYSRPGNAGVHHARIIELDNNGRVSRIISFATHD